MKLRFPLLLAALLWGLLFASAQPAPIKTTPRAEHFTFGPGTTVAADSGLQPLARYAAEYLGCEVRNGVPGKASPRERRSPARRSKTRRVSPTAE